MKEMNYLRDKKIWWFLGFALVVLGINLLVYHFINKPASANADVNLAYRDIETTSKLFLNGYLGHFFKFKSLGNINWLILPVFVYLFYTFKRREKWERAFIVIYCLSLLFISMKGFFNSRYSMTLMPITMSMLMYYLWVIFEKAAFDRYKVFLLVFLVGMLMFNNLSYTFKGPSIPQAKVEVPKFKYDFNKFTWAKLYAILKGQSKEFNEMVNYHVQRRIDIGKAKIKGLMTLPSVLNDVNQMDEKSVFLVNNLPAFYYYGNKKGYYFWCDDDIYYGAKGSLPLMKNRNFSQVSSFMKDSLQCEYIFTFEPYNEYSQEFNRFIKEQCDTVVRDRQGFLILKLK